MFTNLISALRTRFATAPPPPAPRLLVPQLDEVALLALVEQDVELLGAVAEAYFECRYEQLDALREAVGANSQVQAHQAAHRLRGSLKSLCARRGAELAGELEQAALDDRLMGMEGQLQELAWCMDRIAEELLALTSTAQRNESAA